METGSTISTTAKGTSASGNIELHVDTLKVNGVIESIAKNLGENSSVASITVDGVGTLTMKGGKITTSTTGSRDAGGIEVTAASGNSTVDIQGGEIKEGEEIKWGEISSNANPDAKGNAGKIQVGQEEGQFFGKVTLNNGKIETKADVSNSGEIGVYANNLEITRTSSINADNTKGHEGAKPGEVANINVQGNTLTLSDGGNITSSTSGQNPAGTISISASDYIKISGEKSGIFSTSGDKNQTGDKTEVTVAGKAGEIVIGTSDARVPTLTITARGQITTSSLQNSSGEGGNITVYANDLSLDNANILAESQGIGKGDTGKTAGSVTIDAKNGFDLKNEAKVSAKNEGTGKAGSVTISSNTLHVNDSEINTQQLSQGEGGKVQITTTDEITVDKGNITATVNNRPVQGNLQTADIEITAPRLTLTSGKVESSTTGTSNAGTISISASEYINIAGGGSGIFSKANTEATGNAGKITIAKELNGNGSVDSLTVRNGGKISTEAVVSNSGKIDIHANTIAVSGKDSSITAMNTKGLDDATNTKRQAADIEVQGNTLTLSDGGNITSSTSGQNPAGTVTITMSDSKTAEDQDQKGHIDIYGQGSGIFSKAEKKLEVNPGGPAGEIHLTSSQIDLGKSDCGLANCQGSRIETSTDGIGSAGTISISASDYINIAGVGSGIFSKANTEATGNAGKITIAKELNGNGSVDSLTVSNGGQISTNASESSLGGGSITVHATNLTITGKDSLPKDNNSAITSISSSSNQEGKTANIVVNTNQTTLSQRGRIESSTSGLVAAGTISITASEYLKISSPEKAIKGEEGGIFSKSSLKGGSSGGAAGDITILAGGKNKNTEVFNKVELIKKSEEDKKSEVVLIEKSESEFESVSFFKEKDENSGSQRSGNSQISTSENSNSLELSGNSQINTSTETSGNGGTIRITASQLALGEGSEISAKEEGTANKAGSIYIGTDTFSMAKNSKISTDAKNAKEGGGNILIGVNHVPIADPDKSSIPRIGGKITASVTGGEGKGGNVEITSNNKEVFHKEFHPILNKDGSVTQNGLLFVLDGGEITAKAAVGKGGEIKIGEAIPFAKSSDSEVSATSTFGSDGKVEIPSDVGDMGAISRLPGEPVDVSKLIKDCARKTQGQWSLRQGGRGGSKQDKEKDKEEGCKR